MLRLALFCVVLLCGIINSHGGTARYTDRGSIDFDTALQLLNPYGTWSKIDDQWAYTPLDHLAPYTDGRWLYTEYGWYWKGNLPHSWLTEHYGYWKRGANKVWSWYPGPDWLAEIVEFRATSTHIGWRSGAVDQDGNYIESPDDRYAKTDEWTFVTKAQFAGPITPGIVAKPEDAKNLLEDSTDCNHAYLTYRPIDRPGPHPADFLALCKDGGMFSPLQGMQLVAPPSAATSTPLPWLPTVAPATNAAASRMPATNAPALAGSGDDADAPVDKRQVKYWVTMCLPTFWTPRPADAKLEELYIYRPDFYQDDDGIARRITLWFNPLSRTSLKEVLSESMSQKKSDATAPSAGTASPASPAVPANADNPFQSPLDSPPEPGSAPRPTSSSSKSPATGAKSQGLIPPPFINSTNAAPVNGR